MGVGRLVTIGFALAGLVLMMVLSRLLGSIFNLAGIYDFGIVGGITLSGILAFVTAIVVVILALRNERLHTLATEVASELKKVTWPTWKDTKAATIVVIITTLIISFILFSFDQIWFRVTEMIYRVRA